MRQLLLNSESGFSVFQALFALFFLSLMSGLMVDSILYQKKISSRVQINNIADFYIHIMSGVLSVPEACVKTFKPPFTPYLNNVQFIKTANGNDFVTVEDSLDDGLLEISNMRLEKFSKLGGSSENYCDYTGACEPSLSPPRNFEKRVYELIVDFNIKNRIETRRIPLLFIMREGGTEVFDCFTFYRGTHDTSKTINAEKALTEFNSLRKNICEGSKGTFQEAHSLSVSTNLNSNCNFPPIH